MGSESSVEIRGLTKRFGEVAAVDAVSLDIRKGEFFSLLGPSGCGKTTLLRMIGGFELPTEGSIRIGGEDMTRVPPYDRPVNMVFQHYALFPHMPVEENVAFGLEARGVGKAERLEKARTALEAVGLSGAGDRAIQSLSGGEQQRVALARALVIEPRALLLDEPLSNLDPTLRQAMRDDLRAMLRRVGVPALFVTHDQEDAFAIADRIALLKTGKLLQVGTPEELYEAPESREVAAFIGRGTMVPAIDRGTTASVAIGGRTHELKVNRPKGMSLPYGKAFVVLRPEALELVGQGGNSAWPGRVVNRRFAGGVIVYRVELAGGITVDVESASGNAHEDDNVAVAPTKGPFPIVPG
jgi:ABC-type Fe3+/spermidine/putrescine transport system ATPase subunit